MIQDLSGSWCIKGTGESTLVMDSPVPLMHHDPHRFWITDPNSDHPKRTHSPVPLMHHDPDGSWITDLNSDHPKERTLRLKTVFINIGKYNFSVNLKGCKS